MAKKQQVNQGLPHIQKKYFLSKMISYNVTKTKTLSNNIKNNKLVIDK